MATPNIVPRADSEGQLGTSSKYWAAAYIDVVYVGAGKIGRDADNLLDFSIDNNIVFKVNGANELQLNSAEFFPYTSDGLSLGNTGRMWSDLFLASGAVINFDNGNVTLTHSSGKLTLADSDQICFGGGNDLQIFHNGNSSIDNYTGNLTISNTSNGDDLIFKCDNGSGGLATYLTLDGGNVQMIATVKLAFNDTVRTTYGNSSDLEIYHDGTNSYLQNSTGDLYIQTHADDKDIILRSDDGSGGQTAYLTLDGSVVKTTVSKPLLFADNISAEYGSDTDMIMYHSGSNGAIENYTGNLTITNNNDDGDIIFKSDNGAGGIATYFYLDGSSATHDGSATTGLYTNWPDNSRISLGTSHDFSMRHDGTNTVLNNNTGDLYFMQSADGKDIIFQSDDGSSGVATYLALDGSDVIMKAHKSLRFLDSAKGTFGNNDDLQIYHDGSNSYIDDAGTGHLVLNTNGASIKLLFNNSEFMGQFIANGSASLYYDNAKKLETTSTGATLTGALTADTHFTSSDTNATLSTNSDGTVFLRPNGKSSTTAQSTFTTSLATIGTNATFAGTVTLSSASSPTITITDTSQTTTLKAFSQDSNSHVGTYSNHPFIIDTNSTAAITIDTSQNATFASDLTVTGQGFITGGSAGETALQVTGQYSGSGSVHIFEFQRQGGAVKGDLSYTDATTDMELGTSTGHPFCLKTGDTRALTIDTSQNATFAGNIQVNGTLTVGVDDTGHDVIFYGATSGRYLQWDESGDALELKDNTYLYLGTANDLQIYHDGSNSYISEVGTGDLIISADNDLKFMDRGNNIMANMNAANSVELYFGGVKKLETKSTGIAVTGGVTSTSASGNAAGAGFNTSGTVAIDVGEINGEIITTIKVDLGTGAIVSSGTAGDVIGEDDTEGAFLTRITTAVNGIVYRGEMICVEVPTTGDPDINLAANSSSTLVEDGAGEGEHVLVNGGTATLAKHYPSFTIPSGGIQNDHLYLTHGGTTAGTYGAGQFIIKLYGAAVVS